MTRVDSIASARKALGVGLRRRDNAAHYRVRLVLEDTANVKRRLTHAEVARLARTTYETVRAVRRELGDVGTTPTKPTPIGSRLLRGMEPRHVDALRRLARAVELGSDMRVRAVLATPEAKQLLTAAVEAER